MSLNPLLYSDRSFNTEVVTSENLNIENISDLLSGKIAAIRIPNFCDSNTVEHGLAGLQRKAIKEYRNANGVGKYENLGMAYFEVTEEKSKEKYYSECLSSIQKTREVFSPYLAPIDKVRLVLDEQWPNGASLLNLGQGPMFVGLTRAVEGEILPHEDKLERDDPSILSKVDYKTQIAFNVYLKVPSAGGNLQLWDISLPDNVYNHLRGASYGIPRDLLPSPVLSLSPNAGEFIAFRPRYIHAVSSCDGDIRTSASGFFLYQGEDKPLLLWS